MNRKAPWIIKKPEGWDISPFKRLVDICNGRDHKAVEAEEGYPVYGSGGPFAFASDYLYDGEAILLGRKGTIDKPLYANGKFWAVDTMYWSKIRRGACGRFAYYAATTIPFDYYTTSTALPSMTKSTLNAHPLVVPPLRTQKAIADFLDRETARIDQLIEKKQRLVELLAERRQRIIDQLSTDGLQSNTVDKKETGIDWLGKVPKHWTVEKLAWHFTAEKGRDAQKYTKEFCGQFPGPYPVYSGQTANEGVMATIDTFDYDYGDQGVLFSTTVGAKAMTVAHLTNKFSLSQNCMIIVPISKALPIRYFYYLLQPLFRKERSLIPEHMQASFRVEDLHRYWIAMPPNDEAKQIAEVIDTKVATLEPIHQKTQASIERLREFRAALITAAVTGQIDVTTWGKQGQTDRRLDEIEEAMRA